MSPQEIEREETPYDPTIITKLAVHQDRAKSRTRERDQTHSYWYIPSAPRVNYSLLIIVAAGMMKMASGDDFPLRQGAGTGSRLVFFLATETCSGGTSHLGFFSEVWVFIRIFGAVSRQGGAQGAHKPGASALG